MKIVSFNLHGMQADRDGHTFSQRVDRLKEILAPKHADIYFFQECIKDMFMIEKQNSIIAKVDIIILSGADG